MRKNNADQSAYAVYDVDGGCISVDGKDVREVTRESLRCAYGMVLQETWLKTGNDPGKYSFRKVRRVRRGNDRSCKSILYSQCNPASAKRI